MKTIEYIIQDYEGSEILKTNDYDEVRRTLNSGIVIVGASSGGSFDHNIIRLTVE